MTNRKTTRRALVLSLLSLLVCCSMLVGTTFAWFTDSVQSGNNKIIAGNLDIELDYSMDLTNWNDVTGAGDIFVAPAGATKGLWEPGHTEVAYLKITNAGTLALKYQLKVDPFTETIGKNEKGEDIKLSEILKFAATEASATAPTAYTRESAQAAALAGNGTALTEYTTDALTLAPAEVNYIALVVYMPEEVDNAANYRGETVPTIDFALNLLATQVEAENDSFDNTYDQNAWTEVAELPTPDANGVVDVYTAEQLAGVMSNFTGVKTINIKNDIDLAGRTWAPAFVTAPDLVINGNGHTISNVAASGKNNVGFIGAAYQNLTIKDLTFKNLKVEATGSFVGGVIGNAWDHADITLDNVDLVDSEVSTTLPNKGIRVGGLIGYSPFTRGDLVLKNCDVTGSTFTGYHNVGAMIGTTMFSGPEQGTITIENCTAKNNTLKYGSSQVGAFAFGASTSGYTEYTPAGFTAENNTQVAVTNTADAMIAALEAGRNIELDTDVKIDPAGMSNAYGTTGINVKNGQTIDGGGNVLDIRGAGGTWDSGINTTGGVIKNITITGSFRGIFINHNSSHSEPVVLENVIIDGTTYTISCDQGLYQTLEATDSTFNGWTSYAADLGSAKFVDCSFGEGSGYAFCRPYAPTEFVGCDFEAGFRVDPRAAVTFENCTIGGEPLTAANLADLVTGNIANATVK